MEKGLISNLKLNGFLLYQTFTDCVQEWIKCQVGRKPEILNDFSIQEFENQVQEEIEEELEEFPEELHNSRRFSSSDNENSEKFNSVLDFFSVMIERSYEMFDKMMDVLKNLS